MTERDESSAEKITLIVTDIARIKYKVSVKNTNPAYEFNVGLIWNLTVVRHITLHFCSIYIGGLTL
jgi:hypothetical protein